MREDKAFPCTLSCPCICSEVRRCSMSSCHSSVCSSAPYILCSYCHLKTPGMICHTAVVVIWTYLSWGTSSKAREATGHQPLTPTPPPPPLSAGVRAALPDLAPGVLQENFPCPMKGSFCSLKERLCGCHWRIAEELGLLLGDYFELPG